MKGSMHKQHNPFYLENAPLLPLDARCFILHYGKVLGLKANYKVLLSSKISWSILMFYTTFGTSNAIFSSDYNSNYQHYAWSPLNAYMANVIFLEKYARK